jgi:hypothetical protein
VSAGIPKFTNPCSRGAADIDAAMATIGETAAFGAANGRKPAGSLLLAEAVQPNDFAAEVGLWLS